MSRMTWLLMVMFVLIAQACNSAAQSVQATQTLPPTQAAVATATSQPLDTATVENTATALPEPTSTDTATPVPAAATLDPMSATLAAGLGSMGVLMNNPVPQFVHPVGDPLKRWHDVPIMPQATAGQEFSANIYSYIAAATLDQAGQYYTGKAASLGLANSPATGYGGSGDQAEHDISFYSYNLTIVITSYDNDTAHVVVVIAKVP
ncbi:MAG TPA: hypothetical protein VMC62_07945 [Longilinea sp.]|nr:hypothetical protein [Longilinea sp.]